MPHVTEAPPASRFYARIQVCDLECPACGRIIFIVGPDRPRRTLKHSGSAQEVYNPVTSRLACPWCHSRFFLGVICWPSDRGDPTPRRPEDQVPTARQLAEYRQLAQGFWPLAKKRAGQAFNLYINRECTCPKWPSGRRKIGGWSPDCPVHGTQAHPVETSPQGPRIKWRR